MTSGRRSHSGFAAPRTVLGSLVAAAAMVVAALAGAPAAFADGAGPSTLPAGSVVLKDSTGAPLAGAQVDYSPGSGWYDAGTTDASGVVTGVPLDATRVQVSYGIGTQSESVDFATDPVISFHTSKVTILSGGVDLAYTTGSGWHRFGMNTPTPAKQLLPGAYTFADNSDLSHQFTVTVGATDMVAGAVWLVGHGGSGLAGGTASYYSRGWHALPGVTDPDGRLVFTMPGGVSLPYLAIAMTYHGTREQQDYAQLNASSLTFQTELVRVAVNAHDHSFLSIPGNGSAEYYAGGWHAITAADPNNGKLVQAEMLPGTYSFAATYHGTREQVKATINAPNANLPAGDNVQSVHFGTELVRIALENSADGNAYLSLSGALGSASYYAGGWHAITAADPNNGKLVQTEMLPGTYSFAVVYNGSRQQHRATVNTPNANAAPAENVQTVSFSMSVPVSPPPVFGAAGLTGSVTQVLPAGQTLTTTGTIDFTANGHGQAPTVSVTPVAAPDGTLTAHVARFASGSGTIDWTYTVNNELLRHLGAGAAASDSFGVSLSDGGGTATANVVVAEHGIDDPPTSAMSLANRSAPVGTTTTWTVPAGSFTDPDDGDTATLSASEADGAALPAWLSFDSATATFTAAPAVTDSGPVTVVVTDTDSAGQTASSTITVDLTGPPYAGTDTLTFDLRTTPDNTTANLLANDSDPAGTALTASGGGSWYLADRPDTPAGTFTVDADGTLHLNSGTDPIGPAQQLEPGAHATATLSYTVSDGTHSTPGTVTVTVIGRRDGPVQVGNVLWPDQVSLTYSDPNPLLFDARGCFVDPDGVAYQYYWVPSSSVTVPFNPAFYAGEDVSYVSILNAEWGFESMDTLQLNLIPYDGAPTVARLTEFSVTDLGGYTPGQDCTQQTLRPQAPNDQVHGAYQFGIDLGSTSATTFTFGDVLTDVTDPQGLALTAAGSGTIELGPSHTPAGSYTVDADGTLHVSLDPSGSAYQLATGATATAYLSYQATDSAGRYTVGGVELDITGG